MNTKCESMWPFYFKFIIGGFGLNTISTCFGSICLTFISHRSLDAKYFYRPYKLTWVNHERKSNSSFFLQFNISQNKTTKFKSIMIFDTFFYPPAYLGINKIWSDILLKCFLLSFLLRFFWLYTVWSFCCSFPYVCIIVHFMKAFVIQCKMLDIFMTNKFKKIYYANWLDFIFPLKSKIQAELLLNSNWMVILKVVYQLFVWFFFQLFPRFIICLQSIHFDRIGLQYFGFGLWHFSPGFGMKILFYTALLSND